MGSQCPVGGQLFAAQLFSSLSDQPSARPAAEAPCQLQAQPTGFLGWWKGPEGGAFGGPSYPETLRFRSALALSPAAIDILLETAGGPEQRKAGPAGRMSILEGILSGQGPLTIKGLHKSLLLFPASSQKNREKEK